MGGLYYSISIAKTLVPFKVSVENFGGGYGSEITLEKFTSDQANFDVNFGVNGISKTQVDFEVDAPTIQTRYQENGKILLSGKTTDEKLFSIQYLANGSLDSTYASNGIRGPH